VRTPAALVHHSARSQHGYMRTKRSRPVPSAWMAAGTTSGFTRRPLMDAARLAQVRQEEELAARDASLAAAGRDAQAAAAASEALKAEVGAEGAGRTPRPPPPGRVACACRVRGGQGESRVRLSGQA
jgi:hypothetical protein